jgi:hypothetical protein
MKRTALQRKCTNRLVSQFRSGRRAALLQLPTGQGKSLVAADVFRRWGRLKGLKFLLVTPADKPLADGWLSALDIESDAAEAQRAGIPFWLDRPPSRPPNACRITRRQLARFSNRGARPREEWQHWLANRQAFVVVDEFHRSKGWRRALANAFDCSHFEDLAYWLRPTKGRRPLAPAWLCLSATPYNPVELDFQLDRPSSSKEEPESDIDREVQALGSEVEATLFALAALDDLRHRHRRDAVRELVGRIHAALAGHEQQATIGRGPLVVVPGATRHLRPRRVASPFPALPSIDPELDILQVREFYLRLFRGGRRPSGLMSLAERLVLAGVRPSHSSTKLEGHVYGKSTTKSVRKGLLPRRDQLAAQDALVSVATRSLKGGDKVLVFCSHRAVVTATARLLRERVPGLRRDEVAEVSSGVSDDSSDAKAFHEQKGAPRILITSDINSESADLHGWCRTLVHYELPWTPLRVIQRYGRLWRLIASGRQRTPRVFHVVHPSSVGEEILNRLRRRWGYLRVLGIDYVDFETALGTRVPRVPWKTPAATDL